MRLLSLRVHNFKGIETRQVEFRPTGITLIQGPNEVGKTSLMSAFDILLEYADSSTRREVEATKSEGYDRGTEIEAVFQIGAEHFTYFKRYHRERATKLVIESGGSRRTVTGREAHDRVRELLTTTTDWELWKALKIAQGTAADDVAHVALGTSTSLREALDRAAGGSEKTSDDSLFHRVKAERDAYYSSTGREKNPVFAPLRGRLQELRAEVDRFSQRIDSVESDRERLDYFEREIQELSTELVESEERRIRAADAMTSLEALEREHRDVLQQLREVQTHLSDLKGRESERKRLADQESAIIDEIGKLEPRMKEAREEQELAERAVLDARQQNQTVQNQRKQARERLERMTEDATILVVESELSLLERQLDRVHRAIENLAVAKESQKRIRITEEGLRDLRKQDNRVHQAQTAVAIGSPTTTIRALTPLSVTVNGTTTSMTSGEQQELRVTERMTLEVPAVLNVTVAPGTSVSELQAKWAKEREALNELLTQFGVEDLSAAEMQWDQSRLLTRQITDLERHLVEELQDQELGTVEQRKSMLQARVTEYRSQRAETYLYPQTADIARQLTQSAQADVDAIESLLGQSIQELEAALARLRQAHKEVRVLEESLLERQNLLRGVQDKLLTLQQEQPDELLKTQVAQVSRDAERLNTEVDRIARTLDQLQPEQIRARVAQLTGQVQSVTARLGKLGQDRAECQGRLATMGAEGLYEEREEAIASREKVAADLAALERRAHAAKLLYDVVSDCRDKEQRRYLEPLRQRIKDLGSVVFGNDFDVALDENLSVVKRSLHGITLGVEALSTGAKEQLALIVRLAAASLVDPKEGVPIILDDTLGHTDDERLDLMAAVLSAVSKTCQIILLTSATRRYTRIGQAEVIDLWRSESRAELG